MRNGTPFTIKEIFCLRRSSNPTTRSVSEIEIFYLPHKLNDTGMIYYPRSTSYLLTRRMTGKEYRVIEHKGDQFLKIIVSLRQTAFDESLLNFEMMILFSSQQFTNFYIKGL